MSAVAPLPARRPLAEVAVALPVGGTFHYLAPPPLDTRLALGHRVRVPFGRRRVTGYVVGFPDSADVKSLRAIESLLDDAEPLVPASLLDVLRWVSEYYLAALGEVCRTALPGGLAPASSRRLVLTAEGLAAARALEVEGAPDSSEARLLRRLAAAGEGLLHRSLLAGGGRAARAALAALQRKRLVALAERLGGDRARPRRETLVRLAGVLDEPSLARMARRAPRRVAVLRLLRERGPIPLPTLRKRLGEVTAVVKALADGGQVILETVEVGRRVDWALEDAGGRAPEVLTRAQADALTVLRAALASQSFAPFLLHGVTGSGKTEVYLRLVEAALAAGRGAIVLVPEISLTPQLVGRFVRRLGDRVAVLHSGLSDGERLDEWRRVRRGEAPVVVGARSAVFAPVEPLGVIVVDEEQEGSFKQEEGVRYHARDVAQLRARGAGAVCLLGSATPSLESWARATGRVDGAPLGYLRLPERVERRPLPPVEVVDLRRKIGEPAPRAEAGHAPGPVSPVLEQAIEETLAAGRQALLFLNRRGYATFLLCPDCGHRFGCEACAVSLVYHRRERALRCHYCGASRAAPAVCPACGGQEVLQFGSGTERVEEWLQTRFPKARLARLDRDVVGPRGAVRGVLDEVAARRVDILVGTQMVAKGHDFPGVTLVGVLLAESGLSLPDFRAAERTVQLLTQVSGRAGRGETPGRVIVQSYDPEHPAVRLAAAHDAEGFYETEIEARRELGYPPFRRLVNVRVDAPSEDAARRAAYWLAGRAAARLPEAAGQVEMVGPAPAPLSRLRGRHRWHLLLKGVSSAALRRVAGALAVEARQPGGLSRRVALSIDVDPATLL